MSYPQKIVVFSLLLLVLACREKYLPQLNEPTTGYLVVEGFMNSGVGATSIALTRSSKLTNLASVAKESRALVWVEGKVNRNPIRLLETAPGIYTNSQLALITTDEYRLYIKTVTGNEYVSDYSTVRSTPDIDSVSWRVENGGVQLYVNTHDDLAKTKYYQFSYDETWEFTSTYRTQLKVYNDRLGSPHHVGYRDSITASFDESLYRCWKTNIPTQILINTTEKLTRDAVSLFPITYIEPNSWKLGVRYSIQVKENALSQRGYRFQEQLKKNTEQLGSIFDAQPSDNNGNLHCITNPNEVVIGFVEVSEVKQKRIFINNYQVPGWNYSMFCRNETKVPNIRDSILHADGIPTKVALGGFTGLDYVFFATSDCVDCTLRGVNTKPVFWP